jgi:hypothetical protein
LKVRAGSFSIDHNNLAHYAAINRGAALDPEHPMGKFDAILEHAQKRQAQLIDDLKPLEGGQMKIGQNDGTGWRDVTQKWIDETKGGSPTGIELLRATQRLRAA